MLHYFVHPPEKSPFWLVPVPVGTISAMVELWLFLSSTTIHLGYLLNGFAVLIGTITMGYFSLAAKPIWPDCSSSAQVIHGVRDIPAGDVRDGGVSALRQTICALPPLRLLVVHLFALSSVYSVVNYLMELTMKRFKLYQPLWWLLHVEAILFMLWLGGCVKFTGG